MFPNQSADTRAAAIDNWNRPEQQLNEQSTMEELRDDSDAEEPFTEEVDPFASKHIEKIYLGTHEARQERTRSAGLGRRP